MCTIKQKVKNQSKAVTGYKIVIRDEHGNYYSPATGIRYNIGKVRIPTKLGKYAVTGFENRSDRFTGKILFGNPISTMGGRTAVFKHFDDARRVMDKWYRIDRFYGRIGINYMLIEMSIIDDIHTGVFDDNREVYLGNTIVSMKLIKPE